MPGKPQPPVSPDPGPKVTGASAARSRARRAEHAIWLTLLSHPTLGLAMRGVAVSLAYSHHVTYSVYVQCTVHVGYTVFVADTVFAGNKVPVRDTASARDTVHAQHVQQ